MKIKNLVFTIASVIALLLVLIAVTGIYTYVDAARNGNVVLHNAEKPSQPFELGKLIELDLTAFIPWGQEITELTFKPSSGFIAAGEPGWQADDYSLNGRQIIIKLPLRAVNINKTSAGTLELCIARPMFKTTPRQIRQTIELPEIEVVPYQLNGNTDLQLAGEINAPENTFLAFLDRKFVPIVIFVAAMIAIWLLYQKFFRRRKQQLPPWVTATQRLQQLRQDALDGHRSPEWSIRQLTDILQDYLAERFDLPVRQQTTGEFFDSLKGQAELFTPQQYSYLSDFLTRADLIKFARFRAGTQQLFEAIDQAGKLIEETSGNENTSCHQPSTEQNK